MIVKFRAGHFKLSIPMLYLHDLSLLTHTLTIAVNIPVTVKVTGIFSHVNIKGTWSTLY